jgi:hypothetical protein
MDVPEHAAGLEFESWIGEKQLCHGASPVVRRGGGLAQFLDARYQFQHPPEGPKRRVAGEHDGAGQAAIGALIKVEDELHAVMMARLRGAGP